MSPGFFERITWLPCKSWEVLKGDDLQHIKQLTEKVLPGSYVLSQQLYQTQTQGGPGTQEPERDPQDEDVVEGQFKEK